MDIVRIRKRSRPFTIIVPIAVVAVLASVAWYAVPMLLRGASSVPGVSRATIVVDVARVGTLVRSVRASGQLVPDRVHVVATAVDGIVGSVAVRAGTHVDADSEIAELRNPDLDAAVVDATSQRTAALAALRSARAEARAARLDREGAYSTARAEEESARDEAATDTALARDGLIGTLKYRQAVVKADETQALASIARRKIAVDAADEDAKIAVAQAAVERIDAQIAAVRARAATLIVRAGTAGLVQTVTADVGQRAAPGMELARIADERDLKAVLQVAEGDAAGVAAGQHVAVASDGVPTLAGTVARIAPVAVNGSVAVDVVLSTIAPGVRPAQNVDGTIELFRRARVLTIARPVNVRDNTEATLFRVSADGTHAVRTNVRLAAGSPDRVAVVAGLHPGDSVIVSDMSAYAATSDLRIVP
jgi:HlyD family secretion protein